MSNIQANYMQSIANLESKYSSSVHSSPKSSKPSSPFTTPKTPNRIRKLPLSIPVDSDTDDENESHHTLKSIITIPTTPTRQFRSSANSSPTKHFSPLPALPPMTIQGKSSNRSSPVHTNSFSASSISDIGLSESMNSMTLNSTGNFSLSNFGSSPSRNKLNSSTGSDTYKKFISKALDDSDEELDYDDGFLTDSPVKNEVSRSESIINPKHFTSSSRTKDTPLDVKIIFESRPRFVEHNLDNVSRIQFTEFWHLTDEDVSEIVKWNKVEFQKQNILFEIFIILKTFRNNLKRLTEFYGPQFLNAKKHITANPQADYAKCFEPLRNLYVLVDKFLSTTLKPLYDNNFFVDDKLVLESIHTWLLELEKQYKPYSICAVSLISLYEQEAFSSWVTELDAHTSVNSPDSTLLYGSKLFQSYLVTIFTSIALIFPRLSNDYEKLGNNNLKKMCETIGETLTRINQISSYASELDSKLQLSKQLVCSDPMWLETIDLFNQRRTLGFPLEIDDNLIYTLDNCVLILKRKDKKVLVLNRPPIAIQYLDVKVTTTEENNTILTLKDCGNSLTYTYKLLSGPSSLTKFESSVIRCKREFFKRYSSKYSLKLIDGSSFIDGYAENTYNNLQAESFEEDNLIKRALKKSGALTKNYDYLSYTTVFSVDCFEYMGKLYFVFGTTDGMYVSLQDHPESCRKVSNYPRVRTMDIFDKSENDGQVTLYFVSDKIFGKVDINDLMDAYNENFVCDSAIGIIDKKVDFFKIGYQQSRSGTGRIRGYYLFYIKGEKIYVGCLTPRNGKSTVPLKFETMKASHRVQSLDILLPYNFVISHVVDNQPIFYLSDLETKANIHLPNPEIEKELKVRLSKNQNPVGAFNFYLDQTRNDIILVYSNYVVFLSYSPKTQGYSRSRNETIKLSFNCTKATFDPKHGTLVLIGNQQMEVWEISNNRNKKSHLSSCIIAHEVNLLNSTPGKIILRAIEDNNSNDTGDRDESTRQLIMHLRKSKKKSKG